LPYKYVTCHIVKNHLKCIGGENIWYFQNWGRKPLI